MKNETEKTLKIKKTPKKLNPKPLKKIKVFFKNKNHESKMNRELHYAEIPCKNGKGENRKFNYYIINYFI